MNMNHSLRSPASAAVRLRAAALASVIATGLFLAGCGDGSAPKPVSADEVPKVLDKAFGKASSENQALAKAAKDAMQKDEQTVALEMLEALSRKPELTFEERAAAAVADCEIAFLCLPTPQGDDGSADLSYIEAAAAEIASALPAGAIVVNKSTVPVGSTTVVERVLKRSDVSVVSNPEFLREGSAMHDFLHPDRVVVGADDRAAAERVAALYASLGAPTIITDPASAETIKYAANAFLATKLSFVNAIAAICEGVEIGRAHV